MKTRLLSALRSVLTFPYRTLRWMMLARPIRFTRFGTFYILFAIGVGASAINTGNNLLYLILGILLGFIVISGFLSDSGLWGISTDWMPIGTLYAQEKALFDCRVSKGWFPGVAVSVESRWQGLAPILSFAPWIPARGNASLRVEVIPKQRGYLTLASCQYATHFPFGLFQKSHTWEMNDRWIVYPKVRMLPEHLFRQAGDNASQKESGRTGFGSIPFTLRDYRSGDALRQISWKASAKRQRLIVKDMEEEADQGDLFYLRAWPAKMNGGELERFVSFTASLLFTVHEQGRPVGFSAPEAYFEPEHSRPHLRRILEFLALVDPGASKTRRGKDSISFKNTRAIDIANLWAKNGKTDAL